MVIPSVWLIFKDVDLMTDVDATVVTITEVHVKASDLEAEDTNTDEAAEA
mgnify:CR=1 FL=1